MKFNGRAVLTKLELHRARKRSYISRTLIARSRCSHFTQSLFFPSLVFSFISFSHSLAFSFFPFFFSSFHDVVKIHTEKEAKELQRNLHPPILYGNSYSIFSGSPSYLNHIILEIK